MNFNTELTDKDLSILINDGCLLKENFVNENVIKNIKANINQWNNKISSNNYYSSSIIGNNQWIDHLGICSEAAIRLALDENIINFFEKYFNDEIILGEVLYQKKILFALINKQFIY